MSALDTPDQFKPSYELFTARREAWLPDFGLKEFEGERLQDAQQRSSF